MTLLALDRVTKRYSDGHRPITVLEDVSFEIGRAEIVGVIGERGAGKTTLLRVAAGIESPDEGSVRFEGTELDDAPRLCQEGGIALVWGDWRPPTGARLIDAVAEPLRSAGASAEDAQSRALQAIECVGCEDLSSVPTERLSIAERMRARIARALAHRPRLLLIDEPAVLAAPSEARALRALLRSLPSDLGIALIIASEDLAAVSGLPRLLSISDGRLAGAHELPSNVLPLHSRARRRFSGRYPEPD